MKGLLFTYGLTYGGALVSLFSPWYGLLTYVCFAIIRPEFLWFWSVPQGNYSRTVAIALLIGWALHGFGSWNLGKARWIVAALIGYISWMAVCAVFAIDTERAWQYWEIQAKIVLPVIVAISLITTTTQVKQLAWTLVLSQGFVAYEMNMDFYLGGNRLLESGFGSMDNNAACTAMVTVAGLAFFLGLNSKPLSAKLLAFACAGLMAHAPMFAESRGGMLALICVGLVSFVVMPKRFGQVAFFLAATAAGLALAGPSVWERFSTVFADAEVRDASASNRLELWQDAWKVMQENPVLGVGPDNWALVSSRFGWAPGKAVHSTWFHIGAELGYVGIGCLLCFYGLASWLAWKHIRAGVGYPGLAASSQMLLAALSGFLVSASFVTMDRLEPPLYVVALFAGALKIGSANDSAFAPSPSASRLQLRCDRPGSHALVRPASAALFSARHDHAKE